MKPEFKDAIKMPIRILAMVREQNKRMGNVPYIESDKMAADVMSKTFHEFEIMSDLELDIEAQKWLMALIGR